MSEETGDKKIEWVRAHQLEDHFPGLYSRTAWRNFIASGALKSFRPVGVRARLVRIADVEAFLRGGESHE